MALSLAPACRGDQRGPSARAYGHDEPQRGGVLRTSLPSAISTLDPAVAYEENAGYAVRHLYDALLGYGSAADGKGNELIPMLAEAWSVSPDGRVYSFVLRDGLRYSDGRPCVAGDVKYALERVLGHDRSPYKNYLDNLAGARDFTAGKARDLAGVRVVDPRRLEIELVQPDGSFPMIMAMSFTTPLSRDHVEASGGEVRRKPLGTGPFALVSWDEGNQISFRRNPHYWNREQPYLDGVVFYTTVPRDTAFLKFEAGELDVVSRLTSADYLWLSERPRWRPYVDEIAVMSTFGVRMNCHKPPFDDPRVRRALNYAVNKQNIFKIHNGRAVIASGILPPTMLGHSPRKEPYPHDPERARRLLAEAGYPDGLEIEYVTFQEGPNESIAQSMQADFRAIGVDMTIQLVSWTTLASSIGKPDGAPFSFMGWGIDYPDPSNFIDAQFHSRRIAAQDSTNNTFYRNPELDAMIDAARGESDLDERRRRYQAIDELLHHEAPWIWLFHLTIVEVRQPYVMGYAPHPVWLRDFRSTWFDVPPARLRGAQ